MRQAAGLAILLVAMAALVLSGCGQATRISNPLVVTTTTADRVEKVAERVVQELRFQLAYPKIAPERIETLPLTGASWFEFWREDTVGCYQTMESTLHTVRRRVAIAVKPLDQGAEVLVKVNKQRMSNPGAGPMTLGDSFGIHMYERMPLMLPSELEPLGARWIDTGRDDALEQRILGRIQHYLASGLPEQ